MDTVLNVRTNKEVRDKAKKIFSAMGMSTSAGVNIFLTQVVTEAGLPFTPSTNPTKTREYWDAQVSEAITRKKYKNAKAALSDM